jgi:hypothetical protein
MTEYCGLLRSSVGGRATRLILAEQLGGRSPARLFLEINICELLAVIVPHNEAGIVVFLD